MNQPKSDKTTQRYLLFRLGDQTYGTPIMKVREVTEYKEPKPIPNSMPGFTGVINLRGEVLGVIDLRALLNIAPMTCLSFLVFETKNSLLAAMVDRVLAVVEIPDNDIELNTGKGAGAHEYYMGVAKMSSGLVTLINLQGISGGLETEA